MTRTCAHMQRAVSPTMPYQRALASVITHSCATLASKRTFSNAENTHSIMHW
jgi:hypothetical protein